MEAIVEAGAPDEALVDLAQRTAAQLVIVSALGSRGQRRWLTGSVAERVAQSSPCPVLVLRDPEVLEGWLSGGRPLRIVVGCSFDSASKAALRWASSLRSAGPCDIAVAQTASPLADSARFGISRAPLDGLDPDLERLLLRDLRAWAGEVPGEGSTTFSVTPVGAAVARGCSP